jgi:Copper type II ascorbate-dependent monooxygenase, C-terminal domain
MATAETMTLETIRYRRARCLRHALEGFASAICLCLSACGSEPSGSGSSAIAPPTPGLTTPTSSTAASGVTRPANPTATGAAGSAAPVTPLKPDSPTPDQGTSATPSEGIQPGSATAPSGVMPCGVTRALVDNCQTCHSSTPIAGAPMPLMTQADFHKPSPTEPMKQVFEVAKVRIHETGPKRMPPAINLPMADKNALDQWFEDGAQLSMSPSDANCVVKGITTDAVGNKDRSFGRLQPAPGETCYEFKVHQSTEMVDDQPYAIAPGEHYEQFYYKVPWPEGSVATSYATINDNEQVLHHWLMFGTDENFYNDGFHQTVPLPTLAGANPVLITGWAAGAPNLVTPPDVGFELPDPGAKTINVQWHFYNSTTSMQSTTSAIQVCTAPASARKHIAAVTWLGTEDLNGNVWFGGEGMPAHQESTFTATCVPARRGMAADAPIQILGFEPHMHRIGTRMTTVVNKLDGTKQTLFDEPFNFGYQRHYILDQEYSLLPGETLTTSCTFNNTNDFNVPFGESSDTEMCYQFTLSYPAHALANGVPSIIGVSDACW